MATADPERGLLRIGELARQSGKTARALHFYEELGLLVPATRTRGGFRLYAPGASLRLRWIDRLQDLGFSLPEIRSFLATLHEEEHGPQAMGILRDFYVRKLQETRASIQRLRELERDIQESLLYLDGCRACDPLTSRDDCPSCVEHDGRAAPDMVAAIHDDASPDAT